MDHNLEEQPLHGESKAASLARKRFAASKEKSASARPVSPLGADLIEK